MKHGQNDTTRVARLQRLAPGDKVGYTLDASIALNDGYILANGTRWRACQGDNRFAVYPRDGANSYIGQFRIGADDDDGLDSVEETDGAMVINVDLGGEFEDGLLVLQNGDNTPEVGDGEGEARDNTNFKFVE